MHLRRRRTQLHEQSRSSRSTPTAGRAAPAAPATSSSTAAGGGVVDVERQLVVGAELGVQVGEPGHVELRQLGGGRSGPPACAASPRRATAPWTSTTSPSALRRASDSRPRAPRLERPPEGGQGVLGRVGAGAPVGEGDRRGLWRIHGPIVTRSRTGTSRAQVAPARRADACTQVGHERSGRWARMTTVRAQCPACGDVQLHIDDLTVRVCTDDDVPSAYRFRCPECDPDRAPGGEPADRGSPRVRRRSAGDVALARRARRAPCRPAADPRRPPRPARAARGRHWFDAARGLGPSTRPRSSIPP